MIYKRKEIKNCSYLRVVNGAIFCDINGVCYMNWEKTQIPEDTIIFCYQKRTYFYLENELYEILLNGRLKKIIDFCPSSYIEPIENYYLVFNRISRKEKSYKLIDCNKNTIWLDEINWGYKVVKNLLFLFENDNKLSFIDIKTGSPLWSYSLPKGFNIDNKPKLVNNILFFKAYNENQKNQLLTGLDIETGAVIWQDMYEVTNERNFIQATAYNEADQLYYGFYSNYQVFNPKTGKLIFKKEIEDIEKYDLEPYINAIYDDKLWFVSGRGLQTKFGYINIQTQQIELLQDFPQDDDEFFDAPIYHDGKLYLRGKHFNNLYVFE
ncbi:hypothetical protein EDM00_06330 [Ornithobacterium rhinotracheale]|uniref:outer membrane protein assembly factor BamB family protein n=1 Tax=Ornithobacterium rhinotracheale TaxID=28251 RepID=UPI00129CAFA6|nr:PQQ-binding-like beta-propeller repeat protein [Ornithobacterium rhinotracheale]MRI63605.1 hypothetical protein [Ornithobacterium rhinotracheale]